MRRIPDAQQHRFTVDDVLRMQDAGIISEDARLELFEGRLVRMQAKNYAHERIKSELIRIIARALPEAWAIGVETTAYLGEVTYLDPDISIIPRGVDIRAVKGPQIALVIEIADATLKKDLGPKADLYAK
jgi:Uma2 family endonuclease